MGWNRARARHTLRTCSEAQEAMKRMGAERKFFVNVASKQFGAFQPRIQSIGTTMADALRAEDEPPQSDLYAMLKTIFKRNKAWFSWLTRDYGRHATFFRDSAKEQETLFDFIFLLSIEGYPEQRGYLVGAKIKSVAVDQRNGEEGVTLTFTSGDFERPKKK
jgi:hypothetical protein